MDILSASKYLQYSITKELSDLFNESYKKYSEITDLEENVYKFESILDYNYDNYLQFNNSGDLITDENGKPIKYIPVQVGEIMGDIEANPDVFISDIVIPISMIVHLDSVSNTLETINVFNKEIVGKIFTLDYYNFGGTEKFKLTLLPNMPSFENNITSQGDYYKVISFELVGVLSSGVIYGNQIKYSLAINSDDVDLNNITWYNIVKVEPTSSRNRDLHIDQEINSTRAKATTKTTTWVKEMSILARIDDKLSKILILNTDCVRNDSFMLKIEYIGFDMSEENDEYYDAETDTFTVVRKVELQELTYSDDIGDFVEINFTLVERF